MFSSFTHQSRNFPLGLARGLSAGRMVMVTLALLTKVTLATTQSSPLGTQEDIPLSIPEPASMFLGLVGLCLILLRRGRA